MLRRAPDHADRDVRFFQEERYVASRDRSAMLNAFYAVKPVIPRAVQIALRRAYRGRQAHRTAFPAWPVEPLLVEREHERLRALLRASGRDRLPIVHAWPHRRRFCAVLTHDVEGECGLRRIPQVLELEARYSVASAWFFVAEDYRIPDGTFAMIRAAGGEIGLHGIHHDGRLFESRATFEADLPAIHRYMREWDAAGFRSPALHRNPDWMPELGALYDSSFTDTDPFDPQPGGCCSILPYFLGDLVELPLTLVHDFTLFEILRDVSPRRWIEKAQWIIAQGGMVNLLVHPDYLVDDRRLAAYEALLRFLTAQADGWQALPRDVAEWWRARRQLLEEDAPEAAVRRRPELGATVAYVSERDGALAIDHG